MVTENKLNKLSKKFCAYSAAAGAAATAGLAGDAQAAPMIYDTEASPIIVHSSFNTMPNGQNMAAIDPTVASAAGLIGYSTNPGIPNDQGPDYDSGITNAMLDGTVYFRYEIFSEPSAHWGKSGTQFGILNGAGNGLYAIQNGASTRPADNAGQHGGFDEGDVIGDGDNLITSNTVGADGITQAYTMGPGAATQADMHGFGA